MFITMITDCKDENARGRQLTRAGALFNFPASLVGVASDLEAAGNLIDVLDAAEGREGVVLVNVAPRNGAAKKWKNGTPFGYFWYEKTLVVASVDGLTLSLVKKLELADVIHVLDIPESVEELKAKGEITKGQMQQIIDTQFRSFEFLPRIAAHVYKEKSARARPLPISEVADVPEAIWFIDNFGNCKTTLWRGEIEADENGMITTSFGTFNYWKQLVQVPDGELALVEGSSGIGNKRFLEIVIQGKSAADLLKIQSISRTAERSAIQAHT